MMNKRLARIWSSLQRSSDHPAFWLMSSLIFSSNAVISVVGGLWLLALFQAATASLALVAFASVARKTPD
jgi:hypothetical protein